MNIGKADFKGKTVVVVCHDSVPGPPHRLCDYLIQHNISDLVLIGHVNRYVIENHVKQSYIKIYKDGVLFKHIVGKSINVDESIQYILDTLRTIFWVYRYISGHIDYYVGLGNLNAFVGLVLRKLGKVTKCVYYVIDYVPQRFANKTLNSIYHRVDKICAESADVTWNYGKGMIAAREQNWKKHFPNQIHVPHGVTPHKSIEKKLFSYNKTELVYIGTLYEQQGIQVVVEAMPKIKKALPRIHLTIIGAGPYRRYLEKRIYELNLEKHIQFTGFIENQIDVDVILQKGALGIATYDTSVGFVMYTEPGKVRQYLSSGVPVVITKGTPLASDIQKNNCGIICLYNPDDVAEKILRVLKNSKKLNAMRKNAINYSLMYTWEEIYTRAFHFIK